MPSLPSTDLDVHALCLGGNVFGWTADRADSFAVLDAYAAAGGNFIDTSDSYSGAIFGTPDGEASEVIIGEWLARRGRSDDMVIATKVGKHPEHRGLRAENIRTQVETSLRRLGLERIPLLYAHADDPSTPLEETLGAFDALIREGKVAHIAASNFSPERLREALDVSERDGLASYVALQPHYNLLERDYEGAEAAVVAERGLGCLPYFSLAKGFLTGKYRPDGDAVDSRRAEGARAYMDARGIAVLGVLDELAAAHEVPVAAVSLAWLAAQPTVVAPIASARTVEQLEGLLPMASLTLTEDELSRLTAASAT